MLKQAMWSTCLIGAVTLLTGCAPETEPGGPGVNPSGDNQSEATFTLSLPEPTITQGESQENAISMSAGDEFDQKVTVMLTPPAGVTFDPTEFELSKDLTERTFAIQVEPTAAVGEHTVKVVGKPATGEQVDSQFILTIEKADDDNVGVVDDPDANGTLEPAPPAKTGTDTGDGTNGVVEEEPVLNPPDSLDDDAEKSE